MQTLEEPVVTGEVHVVGPAADRDGMLEPAQRLVVLAHQRIRRAMRYDQYSSDSAIARSAAPGGDSTAARSPGSPRRNRTRESAS